MKSAIGLIAKAPIDGEVKTRLCPPLEPHEAREVAISMLRDGADAAGATDADLWCVHTGDPALLTLHLPSGTSLLLQRGAGLAERLANAQRELHDVGYDRVLLVAGDAPTVDTDYLDAGLAALVDHEVVLGPAVDGGYTLIGSSRPTPTLFAVTMSTDAVLDDTIAQAVAADLRVCLLAERGDLDTLQDLVIAMDAGWLAHAPRTLRLVTDILERHGTTVGHGWVGSDGS